MITRRSAHAVQEEWGPAELPPLPEVTVVVPCRNEAKFIRQCLDSIIASRYPRHRLDVLVVDGMSTDGTREIVSAVARAYPFVALVDNPRQTIPAAMNVGIEYARGEIVMKMDAHSTYPPDYIAHCVQAMQISGADNVGGTIDVRPSASTAMARAIAKVLTHPLGSLNSYVKIGTSQPRWVDAVAFGSYRRDLFDRVGRFDERLVRGSDMDLNIRLRRAGGRIFMIPDAVAYCPRPDVGSFWRHNVEDGFWTMYPLMFGRRAFSVRHVTPLVLSAVWLAALVLSIVRSELLVLPLGMMVCYAVVCTVAGAAVAVREGDWRYALTLPFAFFARHGGYGLGSILGMLAVLFSRGFWARLLTQRDSGPGPAS